MKYIVSMRMNLKYINMFTFYLSTQNVTIMDKFVVKSKRMKIDNKLESLDDSKPTTSQPLQNNLDKDMHMYKTITVKKISVELSKGQQSFKIE